MTYFKFTYLESFNRWAELYITTPYKGDRVIAKIKGEKKNGGACYYN